jgi:hypothetical protein
VDDQDKRPVEKEQNEWPVVDEQDERPIEKDQDK